MEVKYLGLAQQFDDESLFSLIRQGLQRAQFILGPEVQSFESRFARFCSTNYALGVNSGTDALFLALKALEVGPKAEVITVPNTFVATVGAIVQAGAKPVFVDVNEEYNMDVRLIERVITKKTKAILPVHLTGNPSDMPGMLDIAKRYGLYVIEDAAQAVGASIEGKSVGSFGTAGCFSLHPLKNLNVCGDGGLLVTNSEAIYEKARLLRNHGLKNRDEVELYGFNSRLDTLQAIIATWVMDQLETITEARIKNAKKYDEGLSEMTPYIKIPPRRNHVRHVFHTYVIQAMDRDKLMAYLGQHGIETKVHYPIPIHLQKASRYLGYKEGDFPVCEKQAEEILSLPVHQYLEKEQLDYVIDRIKKFYDRH
jgi:dTDP-4-amino-4,6-dideoxygalactose transaminase